MQERLIILRKKNNDTQKDLADLLKISETAYREKELGHTQFKLEEMFEIASYYDASLEDIFLSTKTTNRGLQEA